MAEEDDPTDTDTNNPIPPGLSSLNDITPTIYEGGFKTWECATDLAKYLLTLLETGSLNLYNRPVHIIEVRDSPPPMTHSIPSPLHTSHHHHLQTNPLPPSPPLQLGAGTSLPTLTLLSHLLSQPLPSTPPKTPIHLTLADYNPTVLTHASLPNALLTYLSTLNRSTYPPSSDQPLSPALLTSFTAALRARAITLDFISGAWGEEFVQLVRGAAQARAGAARGSSRDNSSNNYSPAAAAAPPPPPPAPLTLVLASETIYAPASLEAFTSTVVELLSPSPRSLHLPPSHSSTTTAHSSLALVAAKRIYFGVGGGVDAFMRSLEGRGGGGGAQGREVWGSESLRGGGGGGGVGRCVLEVRGGEE